MEEEATIHRKFAVDLFNLTWNLMDKKERTATENDTMLNAAHASRYHWEQIGAPLNLARGEWQLARVYALLERAEPARYHAKRCLEICIDHGIGDFDLAFAYEAMARAYAVTGKPEARDKMKELALEASKDIEKDDDREYFLSELGTIPE